MGLTADWKNPSPVATKGLCRNSRRILRSGGVRRCIQGISFYDLSFLISGVRPARYLYKLASETSSVGDRPEISKATRCPVACRSRLFKIVVVGREINPARAFFLGSVSYD